MRPQGPIVVGWGGPIGWVIDKVNGFVVDAATEGFEAVLGGLVAWITDAVVWVVGGVFNFFIDSADPNVQADWFVASDGPYGTMAGVGAVLMVLFLFAGITQGVLSGDVGGMLRRVALDVPLSVLGMVGLVAGTEVLILLTDELSTAVMRHFQEDISDFTAIVTSLSRLGGSVATAFVVLLLGLVTVLAGVILVAELTVRGALIYIVVALAPLVFAARLWPALQDVTKKLLHLLAALIVSKLAMAVALALAASAAVGSGSGGEVTALPPPEVLAEDPGGSVAQAVGILLAAVAAFGVAAFSPLMVARLLPLTESAAVAQGVRGMPVRGAQQAMSMAYYSQVLSSMRFRRLAQGERPATPPPATQARFPAGQLALGAGPRRLALPAGSGDGPRALGRGPIAAPSAPGGASGGAAARGASGGAGAAAAAGPAGVAVAAGATAVSGTAGTVKAAGDGIAARAAGAVEGASVGTAPLPPKRHVPGRRASGEGGSGRGG